MDGMMFTAPDGTILDANPAACRMFERSREELVAAGRAGLMDNSDPQMAVLLAERQRTGRAHGELRAIRRGYPEYGAGGAPNLMRRLEAVGLAPGW